MDKLDIIRKDIFSNVYKLRSFWVGDTYTDVISLQVLNNILKLHLSTDLVKCIMNKAINYVEWTDNSEEVICALVLIPLIKRELRVVV